MPASTGPPPSACSPKRTAAWTPRSADVRHWCKTAVKRTPERWSLRGRGSAQGLGRSSFVLSSSSPNGAEAQKGQHPQYSSACLRYGFHDETVQFPGAARGSCYAESQAALGVTPHGRAQRVDVVGGGGGEAGGG